MQSEKIDRGANFVNYIIKRCAQDAEASAAMRRALNPSLECRAWNILIDFGVDLEKPWERSVFTLIGAAVAQSKITANGTVPLTQALAQAYQTNIKPAESRLRRLLACSDIQECCLVLRPIFKLIQSKTNISIDYAKLLNELLRFGFNAEDIKVHWAMNFYRKEKKS